MARLSRAEITEKIHDILNEYLGIDKDKIGPASRFVEDFGADSLDLVELVMAVEEEFEIDGGRHPLVLPEETIKTVDRVVCYIVKHQGPSA